LRIPGPFAELGSVIGKRGAAVAQPHGVRAVDAIPATLAVAPAMDACAVARAPVEAVVGADVFAAAAEGSVNTDASVRSPLAPPPGLTPLPVGGAHAAAAARAAEGAQGRVDPHCARSHGAPSTFSGAKHAQRLRSHERRRAVEASVARGEVGAKPRQPRIRVDWQARGGRDVWREVETGQSRVEAGARAVTPVGGLARPWLP